MLGRDAGALELVSEHRAVAHHDGGEERALVLVDAVSRDVHDRAVGQGLSQLRTRRDAGRADVRALRPHARSTSCTSLIARPGPGPAKRGDALLLVRPPRRPTTGVPRTSPTGATVTMLPRMPGTSRHGRDASEARRNDDEPMRPGQDGGQRVTQCAAVRSIDRSMTSLRAVPVASRRVARSARRRAAASTTRAPSGTRVSFAPPGVTRDCPQQVPMDERG